MTSLPLLLLFLTQRAFGAFHSRDCLLADHMYMYEVMQKKPVSYILHQIHNFTLINSLVNDEANIQTVKEAERTRFQAYVI